MVWIQAGSDLDWALNADLEKIHTLGAARLMVRYLREELKRYRNSVTTGGPPEPFTQRPVQVEELPTVTLTGTPADAHLRPVDYVDEPPRP